MSTGSTRVFMLAVLCATGSLAQAQQEPQSARDFCIKVPAAEVVDFEAYVRDVVVPLNQVRADSGEFVWSIVLRGVVPVGASARCDYHIVYGYKGDPGETPSTEQLGAALKKANINLTAEALLARRASLSQLVGLDIWTQIAAAGQGAQVGNYVQLNHYSTKPRGAEEWSRLETTYWKPLVEAWNNAGGKGAWIVHYLRMPIGDDLPYNALTVDIFPDWNGFLQGVPLTELWPKVNPRMELTELFDRLDAVRSVHDREVYKVIAMVAAKNAGSN